METKKRSKIELTIQIHEDTSFRDFCLETLSPLSARLNEGPVPSCDTVPEKKSSVRQTTACKCKNSRCLKLYCECFSVNSFCGPNCSCKGCNNKPRKNTLREKAVAKALEGNPQAFERKGCNCTKSECQKKFCECFSDQRNCSNLCRCTGCKNQVNR